MSVLDKEFFLAQFREIHKRFDAHDKRFDEHDKRFDAHDKRFDRVEDRLGSIELSLNRQHQATGELYTMVIDLQHRMEVLESRAGIDQTEH